MTYHNKFGANSAPIKEAIKKIKNAPCTDCGNVFPPECMDFDHVRGVKKFSISTPSRMRGSTLLDLLEELDKCELVCANCHRIRTRKRMLKT